MVHEKYVLQVHIYKPFHIDFCANYVPFSSVSDGVVDKCLIIVTKVYRTFDKTLLKRSLSPDRPPVFNPREQSTKEALKQDLIDPSDSLERLVNVQKTATEAILKGLLLFEERTKQNLKTRLNELKTEALVDVHNTINEAFENVNQAINKGKQEGKKTDECYYYARNNLETKNTNAIAELEACIQNGQTTMESPLANVASSIEATEKLLMDLDAIIPNCYSTSFLKMQACVVKNLVLSGATLKRIASNAREVTTTAGVVYAKTIVDVRSCVTTNTADMRTFSTDIVIYTNNCIRNAPEDRPKPSTTTKPSTIIGTSSITAKPSITLKPVV